MVAAAVTWPTETDIRMGRVEAEEITEAIKQNFDSLGAMLMEARDKKAYKALGYNSFSAYCKTEFGKSMSTAYQSIEDARVVAQLEAEIAKQYTEPVTLKIQPSSLRPLKDLPDVSDKLKAIEYAQKLAEGEGKKHPSKKHLEIAVINFGGKNREGLKAAIEGMGFIKGAQIELTKSLRKDRGFITKIDKNGTIYIELYDSGIKPITCEINDLRLLDATEKPATPASDNTANKGDKVKIFAKGLEGKIGEIYTWKMGKHAIVKVGDELPITIAYAELEIVNFPQKDCDWESELVWDTEKSTYYYFPKEDKIYNSLWPAGLTVNPSAYAKFDPKMHARTDNPIEFVKKWEEEFASKILEVFATRSRVKSLTLAQAIQLPEEEKREFVSDLIDSLTQLLPHQDRGKIEITKPQSKAVGISFSRTIDELTSGKKTQTRRAWQDDYAKNFIRYFDENIAIPALNKGRHRGGSELGFVTLTQRPYQQYLSEMSATDLLEEGGMVQTAQEFIDTFFEGQDKLVWVLHFEFEKLEDPANIANISILEAENQRLREQLTEEEFAIESIVSIVRNLETKVVDTSVDTNVDKSVDICVDTSADTGVGTGVEVWKEEGQDSTLLQQTRDLLTGARHEIEFLVDKDREQGAAEQTIEFLVENTVSTASVAEVEQTQTTDSWTDILETNGFTKQDKPYLEREPTETYREWDIYRWNLYRADIIHPEKGAFSIKRQGIENQIREPYEWLKNVINQIEDFCPAEVRVQEKSDSLQIEEVTETSLQSRIESEREKLFNRIDNFKSHKGNSKREKDLNTKKGIQRMRQLLLDLDKFEQLEIGQTVWDKGSPESRGIITGLTFAEGGLPNLFVKWDRHEGGHISTEVVSKVLTSPLQ